MALLGLVIFSEPRARATSYISAFTPITARCKAVDAPAQAFSTLVTGIASIPMERRITWPRIECWLENIPQNVFEK